MIKLSNCLLYARWRWITKGGWLCQCKSHAGPYPHAIHVANLPDDLEISQYTIDDPATSKWIPLFRGNVTNKVNAPPPHEPGTIDWALVLFWIPYLIGWVTVFWWAAKWLVSLLV